MKRGSHSAMAGKATNSETRSTSAPTNGITPRKMVRVEMSGCTWCSTNTFSPTGGVINGTTKSGSNQFKAGASVFFNPDSLSWKNANVNYKDSVGATQIYRYTDYNWAQSADANFYASGPIVKNKLFYYGLYQV
eukprot:gene48467-65020_t